MGSSKSYTSCSAITIKVLCHCSLVQVKLVINPGTEQGKSPAAGDEHSSTKERWEEQGSTVGHGYRL